MGLALVLLFVGWRTRRWIWVGAAAALLYLASIFPVSRLPLHSLENSYPELPARACPRAEAIVVLSGFCAEAQKQRVTSIILVTTAWHMPRAMQLFRQTALEITPVPVDYQTAKQPGFQFKSEEFFPTARALVQTESFLREWVGYFFYRLKFL